MPGKAAAAAKASAYEPVCGPTRVRGIEVAHILDAEHCVPHPYTSPARIVEGRLSYSQSA
jgi:hypothetical protein